MQPAPQLTLCSSTVIVFTDLSRATAFPHAGTCPEWMIAWRLAGRIAVTHSACKSLAQWGTCFEVRFDDSAKAWLYGKLFRWRCWSEKLIHRRPQRLSPWGYDDAGSRRPPSSVVDRLQVSCSTRSRAPSVSCRSRWRA